MNPGWYPDPDDENARRYWDGKSWSAPLPKVTSGTQKRPSPTAAPAAPFNPKMPIGSDNVVPEDCAWFYAEHPGPLPRRPGWGYSMPQKFDALGVIKGRTLEEIESFVGLPQSWSNMGEVRHATWTKFSAYSVSYSYTLSFDRYDVCFGIVHQYNA